MQILSEQESADIRELFLLTFIDTEGAYYNSQILNLKHCSDGDCYCGYLWDCLKTRERISFEFAVSFLEAKTKEIYALWDIHSCDFIKIPNYWHFSQNRVLTLHPDRLKTVLLQLPEDCYFFDESFSWAVSLTHEEIKRQKRICYLTER